MDIGKYYNDLAPKLTNWLLAEGMEYHNACDLVQNIFLKMCKMRDNLRDNPSDISGLAFTMARNLRKNFIRDNARLEFTDEIEPDALVSDEEKTTPGDNDYLRKKLVEAFGRLAPILRETYTMFQIAELPVKEIARQTGATENLVKVRIFRAKEKLREILTEMGVTF